MPGSKKGERRGGRQKGTPNKKTVRQQIAEARERELQSGQPLQLMGWDILQNYSRFFYGLAAANQINGPRPRMILGANGAVINANEIADYDKRASEMERWAKLAIACATELVSYEKPKLRAILVQPAPDSSQVGKMQEYTLDIFSKGKLIEHRATIDDEVGEEA